MTIRQLFLFSFMLVSFQCLQAQERQTANVFIITLDGLRWEEVFQGAVDSLMTDKAYVGNPEELSQLFDAPTAEERRSKLMPWFWSTLATSGQLYGNRAYNNNVDCANPYWFSYPGYSEILCGFVDEDINSNKKVWNPNKTILEWFNDHPRYNGRVAAFGSWDVFPYIINEQRSGIPVNAGFEAAEGPGLSQKELFLNQLQPTVPSPWATVRLDAFTHHYCLEYVKRKHPKLVYIAYGETDDFAHDGAYDHYLKSAHHTDQWIKELWEYVQSDPFYAGKTTFLITTDHGRGSSPKSAWKSHGAAHKGSDAIWFGIIGPDTPARGELTTAGQWYQNQVAKTAAAFLGMDYAPEGKKVGEVIKEMFNK